MMLPERPQIDTRPSLMLHILASNIVATVLRLLRAFTPVHMDMTVVEGRTVKKLELSMYHVVQKVFRYLELVMRDSTESKTDGQKLSFLFDASFMSSVILVLRLDLALVARYSPVVSLFIGCFSITCV